MPRTVLFFVFPDFQILDLAGPVAAFEIASRVAGGAYAVQIVAADPGPIESSAGLRVHTQRRRGGSGIDTFIVAGGTGAIAESQRPRVLRAVRRYSSLARRTASVCTGAFILAEAGLLDGRVATTHWSRAAAFRERFAGVSLDADRIFIKDGDVWTSAGITAGIDMALAMIREDCGEEVARRTARQLVVYFRRPGGQSQFSALLELQDGGEPFSGVLEHVRANLTKRHSVEDLAAVAGMSPRHFARTFSAELRVTPAKAVERLRVEAARLALESGVSTEAAALECGFGNAERLRKACLRQFAALPSALKRSGYLLPLARQTSRSSTPAKPSR